MDKQLYAIYQFFQRHTWAFYLFLGVYILLTLSLASRLSFEEDITKLIPSSKKAALTNKVLQQMNFSDKVVVLISVEENGSIDEASAYANKFVDRLAPLKEKFIDGIQGRISDQEFTHTLDFIYAHLPLFLQSQAYDSLRTKLQPEALQATLLAHYKSLMSPTGIASRTSIRRDPLGLTFLGLESLQALNLNGDFNLVNGFISTANKKHLLLFINPKMQANETDKNAAFVNALYVIQDELNQAYEQKISSAYYGTTVIAVANANQIKRDIQRTVTIAMSILMLILIFFYRSVWIPILLFIPPALGGLLGVASLFVVKGQVSAISLGIGAVLLGITLDYSLHILTHFRNNKQIESLFRDVAKPILMSGLTTAVAFLCLLFLSSGALNDLGIFAAISVVSAAGFSLICIPQWLYVNPRNKRKNHILDGIAAIPVHRKPWAVGAVLLLLFLSLFWASRVDFDKDIRKLNYQTPSLIATEKTLDTLMNQSAKSLYVVSYGENVDSVLTRHQQLAHQLNDWVEQGQLISQKSISHIVQSEADQRLKIDQWQQFWKPLKSELREQLIAEGQQLGFKPQSFNAFYSTLERDFSPLSIDQFSSLNAIQIDEFIQRDSTGLTTVTSLIKADPTQVKAVKSALSRFHQTLVIDRQEMNETFLGSLKDHFNQLIAYSLLAVLVILYLFYKRFILVLITVIPIVLTWSLTLGLMGWFGIDFNIFNVIISTFIFGLGVDYSIFITNGLRKEYTYGTKELPTYKTSILLSVITTVLSLGVLIFAKHPALKSISWVSIIGIIGATLVCFVIQPQIFKFFISGRAQKGLAPLKVSTLLLSIFLSLFYALGGMLLSVFSVLLLPLIPISKKRKMKGLHNIMSKLVTATLYGNPLVKKQVFNPHKETFTKPAVIIANHASALDTLTLGMVTPNVIYLVNDWVYKSPIFGLLARVAGFYPVSSGIDGSLDHLQEKVSQGYALVVFPEGRRSKTNKIGRFHKGAFFLAEALQLDILPLYLHGNAEVMPKGDFAIHPGHLQVHIGKRIPHNDTQFGSTERERTKRISQHFKANFQDLRNAQEGPRYYEEILYSNYRYKDGVLAAVKLNFQGYKRIYQQLQISVPLRTTILVLGAGYGELPILLVAKSQDRSLFYIQPNPRKRQIVKHCYTVQRRGVRVGKDLSIVKEQDISVLLIENRQWSLELLKEYVVLQVPEVLLFSAEHKALFIEGGYREEDGVEGLTRLVLKSKQANSTISV